MSSKEKANLARIRDNQRRSRARRKEYLQELEARLRQCELQGIEASSEIQMAARRVADENKKLRGLLVQHGVGEDTIETYLQTSPTTDTMMGGQYGSSKKHLQPHTAPQRSSIYIPTTSTSNVNNCNYATDMITTMAGGDPSAVRQDLGCLPGMDCEVDNHLVFNVMDRYTGSVGL
ncbi:uncharacterized protein K444DRAFT_525186 [Hyaloscypha bicolor E]|uniref:BZIP domain-containing protein n=1 Tax=Hyaloscypha bicolor E TaxID=1095630 RepID=A0A2J6TIW6_9HELO|nr:uncharacterized protein K444DRAFT_525186 [Hyaloscypha bicolor E]PMD62959.1 hypothetical protein K444DRAFT_525186 [Hyaloscypha bicolor E]